MTTNNKIKQWSTDAIPHHRNDGSKVNLRVDTQRVDNIYTLSFFGSLGYDSQTVQMYILEVFEGVPVYHKSHKSHKWGLEVTLEVRYKSL